MGTVKCCAFSWTVNLPVSAVGMRQRNEPDFAAFRGSPLEIPLMFLLAAEFCEACRS